MPIELKPRYSILLRTFLISLAVAVGGYYGWKYETTDLTPKIIGSVMLFFGGVATLVTSYKILTHKSVLSIRPDGIVPTLFLKSSQQLIFWEDIEYIGIAVQTITVPFRTTTKERTVNYLAIYLKNPEKYRFDRHLSKTAGQEIVSTFGNSFKGGLAADVFVPENMLPKLDMVFQLLSQFPVKIDRTPKPL